MAQLGTWDTYDCPVNEEETREAFQWLSEKVGALGGNVRKIQNPHDFGTYPSFEIDKPAELDFYDEEEEDEEMAQKVGDWQDGIDAIELEYCKRYHSD